MEENEKKWVAIEAALEGQAIAVSNMGEILEISEMELMLLVNLATLGCLSVFINSTGDVAIESKKEWHELTEALSNKFSNEKADGLHIFVQGVVAMLGRDKYNQYLLG